MAKSGILNMKTLISEIAPYIIDMSEYQPSYFSYPGMAKNVKVKFHKNGKKYMSLKSRAKRRK